ncbi:MAG TPA: hypothetical protein VN941_00015 [Bradyrhizobium sp.]|nr:hypothetical protein [Bradyrhizobium sp.]
MPTLLSVRALQDDLAFVDEQLRRHTDPYDTVRFMWQQRHDQLQRELSELESSFITYAEVALLFEGAPVRGSEEIKLAFATKMLDQYQLFVGTIAAEKGGAIVAAKGQLPRAFTSRLFIRDMLRGSVGFLLQEPQPEQGALMPTLLKDAIEEATQALTDLASGETEEFHTRVDSLSPRAVNAVKKIIRTLNESDAEIKIVGADGEVRLDRAKIASLHVRLNELEVLENREEMTGVLLGILPDRQQYEFRVGDDGPIIYGPVSEDLDERYLANPDFAASILLKPVTAQFLVITKVRAGQVQTQQKVLERIKLADVIKSD